MGSFSIVKGFKKRFITPYLGLPSDIYFLFIARIVNKIGMLVYPFLTLFLTKKLGLSTEEAGEMMLISAMTFLVGAPVGGKLTDLFGRKKILLIFQSAAAICFVICAFLGISMTVPYILILASLLNSIAGPASSAMVTDLTTPENRKAAFSLLYLGTNVGAAIGPGIAGLLFESHMKWIFIGDGITSILSLILVFLFVRESIPTKEEIENSSVSENENYEHGSVFSALLKRPILVVFVLISSLTSFAYSQHSFSIPLLMKEIFPKGTELFGMLMMINGLFVLVATAPITSLTNKLKPVVNMAIAAFTYVVGFGMLYFINDIWLFVVSTIIWTIGEILVVTNASVYIANHSPINQRGRFSSIFSIISGAGYAVGPMLMGKFITSHGIRNVWIVVFLASLAAFVGFINLNVFEKRSKGILNEKNEI